MSDIRPIHFAGTDHRLPERDSRGYARVVARGCAYSDSFEGGAFSCDHGYAWECDDCPVNDAAHIAFDQWQEKGTS